MAQTPTFLGSEGGSEAHSRTGMGYRVRVLYFMIHHITPTATTSTQRALPKDKEQADIWVSEKITLSQDSTLHMDTRI